MSANVTVAARISKRLKEALDVLAGKLGMKLSKLGRVAVRLYLRQPPVPDMSYELVRLAKKFPNGDKVLVGVALEEGEAERLRELAGRYKRSISDILTLALADVLNEPHDAILEESYAMGPSKAYRRAVEAGIVEPVNGFDKPIGDNPDNENGGNKSAEKATAGEEHGVHTVDPIWPVLATIVAFAMAPAVLWAMKYSVGPWATKHKL